MAIANGLALPNPLSNGTTASAVDVMADYNYLLGALNRALLDSGGGAGVNAQSTQIHNLANGAAANDAVNLSQLGGYALLAGATFTGSVGFTQPISATSISAASLTLSGLLAGSTLTLSGNATLANFVSLQFTDTNGGHPYFNAQNDNNFVFYGTDATGAARPIWNVLLHNSTAALTISVNAVLQGALSAVGALTTGNAANCVGYLGTPQTVHTANYTFALGDQATDQAFNGVGLTGTIPANASVAFPIGTIIVGTNLNASPLTIAITSDMLIWSGTTTTGPRTIGQNGEYRLRKITATSWLITGTAMS